MLADLKERINPDKWRIAPHVLSLEASIIREILKVSSQPGVISFAGGLPAPETFPIKELKQITCDVLDQHGNQALQYALSRGIIPLREIIAKRASESGTETSIENLLITTGAQQAIELIARAFIEPGDYILTENPTYVGALQAFNYYRAKYVTVDMDDEGMLVDKVSESIERYNPKLIYTVSNYQNPTGITMSLARREQLVTIAAEYDIPIIDDNPYGHMIFTGEEVPSLKSIGGDEVIGIRSFSKSIAPGFRIGWLNGPEEVVTTFEKVKQCTDLHSSTFSQYIIYEFIKRGLLDPHNQKVRAIYHRKRDRMLAAMDKLFPAGVKWTRPNGGMFLWVELPKHLSARELLPEAIERKVAYVYGEPFFANGGGENTMRLNFATASHEDIDEGIERLGSLLKQKI